MRRPAVLMGILAVILLLCVGLVIADQKGMFAAHSSGAAGSYSGGSAPAPATNSGSDPYGGVK